MNFIARWWKRHKDRQRRIEDAAVCHIRHHGVNSIREALDWGRVNIECADHNARLKAKHTPKEPHP